MAGVDSIVSFQGPLGAPTVDHPRAERLVSGNPERRTWNLFTDASESVFSGIWECEPGAWQVSYPLNQDEFCTLLSGRVRLTDASGATHEFGPGDAFVIPGGFAGVWETLSALRKLYVIVSKPIAAP